MQMISSRLLLALTALALLLGACATPPSGEPAPPPRADELARLTNLEAKRHWTPAAQLAAELAGRATPPLLYDLRLRGADSLVKAHREPEALSILDGLARSPLKADQALWLRLIRAEIALARERPNQAMEFLAKAPTHMAPPDLQHRYLADRAEAFHQTGHLLDSAKARAELDLLLEERQERAANQRKLLGSLRQMTDTSIELLRPAAGNLLGGWMDLARIFKATEPGKTRNARLGEWLEQHPSHPVLAQVLDDPDAPPPSLAEVPLEAERPVEPAPPALTDASGTAPDVAAPGTQAPEVKAGSDNIAVLLPEGGKFAEFGAAIRAGLEAANQAELPELRVQLRYYDASDPALARELVQKAADEGAKLVIGPLAKDAVEQLARAEQLPLPVVALNRVATTAHLPPQLLQFSLDPEDEARQAAEQAWADGARIAISLLPQGAWGDRLRDSFRSRWEGLGGRLAGHHQYNPETANQEGAIDQLLELVKDSDLPTALFLVAPGPDKAAKLWPQVRDKRPPQVRVYATSHAYGGRPNPSTDRDLVGLTFPDLPWVLLPNSEDPLGMRRLAGAVGNRQGLNLRLFAMGLDAYRIAHELDNWAENPQAIVGGTTGQLSLGPRQTIQRRLTWARMGEQGPEPLAKRPDPAH